MPRLAQCWFWAVTIWRLGATRVAVIKLTHAHSMTIDEIDRAARALAVQLKERYGVESEWLPDRIVLIGSGVSGFLQVASDHLVIEVRLGLALSLLKRAIEREITDYLRTHVT